MQILDAKASWKMTKVRSTKEVIQELQKEGRTVHFATLMNICHLKNSELEPKLQKYTGRVVLRGDVVKDDSGSHVEVTEQGSSASQMTAAKGMDVIARLPECAGQAADAISVHTQVKMEDARVSVKLPKSVCPDIWMHPFSQMGTPIFATRLSDCLFRLACPGKCPSQRKNTSHTPTHIHHRALSTKQDTKCYALGAM